MKNLSFLWVLMLCYSIGNAQIKTPQASPKAVVNQVVGLTNVEIAYSRPSAKGRDVFNYLVPFGKLWRTGANENTTITFSEDVVVDGKKLPKGKYALYTTPKADIWEIIFYSKNDNWGNPELWDDTKVALKTTVKSEHLERFCETFTIGINSLDANFAFIEFSWENTIVSLKFEVPTAKNTIAAIDKVLAGPTAEDYYTAAQYYLQSNVEIPKALVYINKALEMNSSKPYFYYRSKALIQAKNGDKKGAIESAKISLSGAEMAKNQDYIKWNKESIAEWSKK